MPYNQEDLAMTTDLKCCVIIPTYNNDQTLEKIIRDVKRWTCNIIVVNDGSTDTTKQIVDDLQKVDPKIKLVDLY